MIYVQMLEVCVMKEWMTPTIEELDISETEHTFLAKGSDGGTIGDGQIGTGADSVNDPS